MVSVTTTSANGAVLVALIAEIASHSIATACMAAQYRKAKNVFSDVAVCRNVGLRVYRMLTVDSVPEMEWQETEHKARALIRAAELVEEGF